MQTPKTRAATLEVPQRTQKTARQLKTSGSEADNSSSQNSVTKTPKVRSPKVVDRRSPRTPTSETKRPGRVSELETQLANLQEELKKAKNQLSQSESLKKRANEEAENAKKQLAEMSEKLQNSQQQLDEISASEDSRLQELRKISHERDRAWESELVAVQKHHSTDSAAAVNEVQKLKMQLAEMSEKLQDSQQQLDEISASEDSRLQELRKISQDRDRAWESELEAVKKHHSTDSAAAVNEVQKFKMQLENSEANQAKYAESAHNEMLKLRVELSETLAIIEELKIQLKDSQDSEARALEITSQTRKQLETVESTEETLRLEKLEAVKSCDSLTMELEKSKAKVDSLERIVTKLEMKNSKPAEDADDDDDDLEENNCVKMQVEELKEELERAEKRYQEEYIKSTLQIRSAYELVEQTRTDSSQKVSVLVANLEKSKVELEDMKAKLQNITEENKILNEKFEKTELATVKGAEDATNLNKLEADLEDMKRVKFETETELKNMTDVIQKLKMEKNQVNNEAARVAEKEALMRIGYLTEEVDKSSKKVERVTEQLDLAQASNAEMEAELRRLKVQTDQWRKAAEAAAAMLSGASNGKFLERTGSLDTHTIGGKLNSPLSEDMEDESPKKKNGNMLKKFGVFMKSKR